jgi:hypothetical protein
MKARSRHYRIIPQSLIESEAEGRWLLGLKAGSKVGYAAVTLLHIMNFVTLCLTRQSAAYRTGENSSMSRWRSVAVTFGAIKSLTVAVT